jgi:hypothetical protein
MPLRRRNPMPSREMHWIEFRDWLAKESDGSPYIAVINSECHRRMQLKKKTFPAGPGRPKGTKNKPGHHAGRPRGLKNKVLNAT